MTSFDFRKLMDRLIPPQRLLQAVPMLTIFVAALATFAVVTWITGSHLLVLPAAMSTRVRSRSRRSGGGR